jgi:hypothetical protein
MLINFCDSSFAIGENQETGLRYLKQIKARNTEIKFDAENVKLCRINCQFLDVRIGAQTNCTF